MGNYAGHSYQVGLGIRDQGTQAVGSGTQAADAFNEMKLQTVNDVSWDGAFSNSTVMKSGRRTYQAKDYINVYGAGEWTWDFDYLVEDQVIAQKLLSLINPTGSGNTCATTCTITENPAATDIAKGAGGAVDGTADILIQAPQTPNMIIDEDRVLQSAVLQNLTLSCDSGTDGGRPHMSGQFMTGFKPTVSNSGLTLVAPANAAQWDYSLFDFTTLTVCGVTSVVKSFSLTIDNPATRVGWQGTSAECDGYIRAGLINITGEVVVKLTDTTADLLDTWITSGGLNSPANKTTTAITLEKDASWSISLPAVLMTGYAQDQSNDGIFVTIGFIATAGTYDTAVNPAVIKMT
tara:strand:+ start:905 stop:1951 length:1047 start_codon:yes stop_codon:yes gene_type:complete